MENSLLDHSMTRQDVVGHSTFTVAQVIALCASSVVEKNANENRHNFCGTGSVSVRRRKRLETPQN